MKNEIKIVTDCINKIAYLYEEWAKQYNVNSYVLDVLYAIRVMGITKQKKIIESWGMPKQTVNTVIIKLQNKNYIRLIQDKNDKRSKIIELTPEGEVYADLILNPLLECENSVFESMGKEDIDIWIKIMRKYARLFEDKMKDYKSGGK